MKFKRTINDGKKSRTVSVEFTEDTSSVNPSAENISAIKETVPESVTVAPSDVKKVIETPVEDKANNTLKFFRKRFDIPPFEPTIPRVGDVKPEVEEKKEVDIPAWAVKSVEVVDEIPEGVLVTDGVNIVGDLAVKVEEQLEEISETLVKQESVVKEVSAPVDDEIDKVIKEEATKQEESTTESVSAIDEMVDDVDKVWDKFVENVVIPTLTTCLDRLKDYVDKVLADELKKESPLD